VPSALGHAAPALGLIPAFHGPGTPRRLWALGVLCALAPDLDVATFALGVPYAHPLGHRGLWHSVPFAAATAAAVTLLAFPLPRPGFSRARAFLYLFLATASHGVLDAFTDGGLGVALLGPFDQGRYFFPFRPIPVSPLGVEAFVSPRGASILARELLWVWVPFFFVAVGALLWRGRPTIRSRRRPIG
jgi:inner membrane protein